MRIEAAALLFDSDGVLIDSHHLVNAAWRQLAEEFDLNFEILSGQFTGKRSEDTLRDHLSPGLLPDAVGRLEDIEVDMATGCTPIDGAIELLDSLPEGSWTIVTSGSARLAEARWRGAGIPVPAVVVTADDVSAGKPSPQPYLKAAAILGVEPARSVVFEDASPGGEAGRAAGATVVAVGRQHWTTKPLARVDDLSQVTASASAVGVLLEVGV
jgi:mannitol-1-/sugar-/sorbitol-6-phosphatase